MKYVKKLETPSFFIDDTKGFEKWDDYDKDENTKLKRRNLRAFILEDEQFSLCIYCESRVDTDTSHIEHIKPKDKDLFPELTFDYDNLAASCQGNVHVALTKVDENIPESTCGHKKSNEYNDELFLSPHTETSLNSYFKYCKDTGKLTPSDCDKFSSRYLKAIYMITTLKLNDGQLPRARLKAGVVLKRRLKREFKKDKTARNKELQCILQRDSIAFISFLRYSFK